MRIVGLDVGERRIGVAISDATRTLARPLSVLRSATLDRDALEQAAREVSRLAREEDGVAAIVVGLPRRLDGTPNEMTPRVESFAKELSDLTHLPIVLQDERLSSREAESRLARARKGLALLASGGSTRLRRLSFFRTTSIRVPAVRCRCPTTRSSSERNPHARTYVRSRLHRVLRDCRWRRRPGGHRAVEPHRASRSRDTARRRRSSRSRRAQARQRSDDG